MRYLLLLLLTFCSFIGFAQNSKFEKFIGWKGGGQFRPIALKTFSNKPKTLTCVTLVKADSLRAYVLNEQLQVVKEIKSILNADEEVSGGFFTSDKVSIILKNKYEPIFHNLVHDINNSLQNEYGQELHFKGKKLVGSINAGDSFYYITSEKKAAKLNVAVFNTDGNINTTDFDFNNLKNLKVDKSNTMYKPDKDGAFTTFFDLSIFTNKLINVSVIDEGTQTGIEGANSKNKLYARGDSLLLLMDVTEGITEIYSFNLKNKTSAFRFINRKLPEPVLLNGIKPFIAFNSFLVDSTLYYAHAASSRLTFQAHDFYDGKLKSEYETDSKDSIEFKNTPIYQEREDSFYGTARRELSTKQLLRKMVNGNVVISGIKNDQNQHELIVGAYIEQKGGAPMMMGGGSYGATGQGMQLTVSSGYRRASRFQALFNPASAKHIEGTIEPNGAELANKYAEDKTIPAEGSDTFTINQGFYYTYYSRDELKLVVVKLK